MSKKGMYHSELAKMSPVTARIMSEPQESKFPDRPKWIALEIDGEERYLSLENTAVELTLAGLKGQWARLNAKGRGEDAVIEILDEANLPERSGHPQGTARTAAAKAESNKQPVPSCSGTGTPSDSEKLKAYAAHSLRVFSIAWEESKTWLATIPERDAEDLPLRDWYDLRLRVAQGIAIEVNKIIRKERF